MSDVIYHRCDMCGDLIVNEFHRGFFHGATCRGSSSDFDLCDACSARAAVYRGAPKGEGDE